MEEQWNLPQTPWSNDDLTGVAYNMSNDAAFTHMLRRMRPEALSFVNRMPYARLHLADRNARQRDPVLRTAYFIYANYVRVLLGKEPRPGC